MNALGPLSQMQLVSAGFAPVPVADTHGESAAVGCRVGDKIIFDRIAPDRVQQRRVRPIQLKLANEIRRPQRKLCCRPYWP